MSFSIDPSLHPLEAQALIDAQIRQLNNLRNAYSALSGLPPEILGNIFVFASRNRHKVGSEWELLSSLFNFSFVSQHWRGIALATPDIWGILYPSSTEWTRVALERAKSAGLTLEVEDEVGTESDGSIVWEVIRHHMHHVQVLKIHVNWDMEVLKSFLDALPSSAPFLRTLGIIYYNRRHVQIPPHCLTDVTLSHLELRRCKVDWNATYFKGLKSLDIIGCSTEQTLLDLLEALRNMPELESLTLLGMIPLLPTDATNLQPPVTLAHLKLLKLTSHLDHLYTLSHLRIPLDVKMSISEHPAFNSAPWLPLVRGLFSALQPQDLISAVQYHSLSIYSQERLSAWRVENAADLDLRQENVTQPDFALSGLRQDDTFLPNLLSKLPSSQLKWLYIDENLQEETCRSIFANFLNPKFIVLAAGSSKSALRALCAQEPTGVPSPCLEYLRFDHVRFGPVGGLSIDDLYSTLRNRAERNAKVSRLVFTGCRETSEEEVLGLSGLVGEIFWR